MICILWTALPAGGWEVGTGEEREAGEAGRDGERERGKESERQGRAGGNERGGEAKRVGVY